MTTAYRFGKRWTINECLQLQREYELLEWSIDEIAAKHQRTPNAIMFKLDEEEMANYTTLHNNYYNLNFTSEMTNANTASEYDHCEDVDDNTASDDENEEDEDNISTYCDEEVSTVSDDLRTRVNTLEKRIDDLTQLILAQNKKTQVSSSWFL